MFYDSSYLGIFGVFLIETNWKGTLRSYFLQFENNVINQVFYKR